MLRGLHFSLFLFRFPSFKKKSSPLSFLSILERKHFGGPKEKTPRLHYLFIYFFFLEECKRSFIKDRKQIKKNRIGT